MAVPLRIGLTRWFATQNVWWFKRRVVALPVVAAFVAALVALSLPREYTAHSVLLPPQTNVGAAQIVASQVGGNSHLGLASMAAKSPSELYVKVLTSSSVVDYAIDHSGPTENAGAVDRSKIRSQVRGKLYLAVGREGSITVSFADKDPRRAALVCNQLVAGMYAVGRRVLREHAQRQLEFYDKRIQETRLRLESADDELRRLEASVGLTRIKGQEEASTGMVAALKDRAASLQVELNRMRRTATEAHPEVQRTTAELEALLRQLALLEQPSARPPTDLLVAPVDYAAKRRAVEPARREVSALTSVLESLLKSREESRIDESRELTTITVLDPAEVPTLPSGPNRVRIVVSAFMGGLLLALLWTYGHAVRQAIRVQRDKLLARDGATSGQGSAPGGAKQTPLDSASAGQTANPGTRR